VGKLVGLPRWWMPINLTLAPAAGALLDAEIPPPLFLAAFCVLYLVNANAWRERVPLFLSSGRAANIVTSLLPAGGGFRCIDLGCGTGSLLADLARMRPDGRYDGVELAPLPFAVARWRAHRNRSVQVRWGNFWHADLSRYDVVYAYLSPVPMPKLWRKARREMRAGSLLVSNGFCVPGVAPTHTFATGDRTRSTLYVWRM
jgi:SAM-dependent methyltransferase